MMTRKTDFISSSVCRSDPATTKAPEAERMYRIEPHLDRDGAEDIRSGVT